MACVITASFVDYRHPVNAKLRAFEPYTKVRHTEYRKSLAAAKVEVFKYLLSRAERMCGSIAPDGESHIIPDFRVEGVGSRFLLSSRYYGKNSCTPSTHVTYSVEIKETDSIPEGQTFAKGAFTFDDSYDSIPVPRSADTITDWTVGKITRLPFKNDWDMVKVELSTPSGKETAYVNCELKHGKFSLRELQDCKVTVSEELWDSIQKAFAKAA